MINKKIKEIKSLSQELQNDCLMMNKFVNENNIREAKKYFVKLVELQEKLEKEYDYFIDENDDLENFLIKLVQKGTITERLRNIIRSRLDYRPEGYKIKELETFNIFNARGLGKKTKGDFQYILDLIKNNKKV